MATLEKVAAVASEDPQIAPNNAQAPIVAFAKAPRIPENSALQAWNNSAAIFARDATAPIKIKSGMTDSE
jgi:hypothetical protein